MLISADNISKSYGSKVALQPLSFSVNAGNVLGLLGANGGGKTTILKLIAGLLVPDSGSLEVLGMDMPQTDVGFRSNISYMAQDFTVYPDLTVVENLTFRAKVYGIENHKENIDHTIDRFKLRSYSDVRAKNLSGGWARMLQLAAAVLHKPKLILLDEPTAGLDAAARQTVWQHISEMARSGVGVVISTHDLIEAAQCSHALFLSAGELLASGQPQSIINQSHVSVILLKNISLNGFNNKIDQQIKPLALSEYQDGLRLVISRSDSDALKAFVAENDIVFSEGRANLIDASAAFLEKQQHSAEGTFR